MLSELEQILGEPVWSALGDDVRYKNDDGLGVFIRYDGYVFVSVHSGIVNIAKSPRGKGGNEWVRDTAWSRYGVGYSQHEIFDIAEAIVAPPGWRLIACD